MIRNQLLAVAVSMLFALGGAWAGAAELSAQWLWADVQQKTPFQHVMFKKDFTLDAVPEKAQVLVTADTFYRLRLNGALVMHGPARSSAEHATVDGVDVRPYLRAGANELRCEAVHGDFMFEALAQEPGFLCELRLERQGQTTVIASDASWSACELTAWDRQSPKYALQRGWVEDVDGRKDVEPAWKPAVVLGPVGMEPWKVVELRDIPLPASLEDVRPRQVVSVLRSQPYTAEPATGTLAMAQGTAVLPLTHWACRLVKESVAPDPAAAANPAALLAPDQGETVLHGDGAQVVYDFGASQVGFIGFEVTGKAGQVLELAWNERLSARDNVPRPEDPVSIINGLRYTLRDGRQTFLSFSPYLARYLRVIQRGEGELTLHGLWIKDYRFPMPDMGGFTCSDDALNAIYAAARRTAALSTLDVFMDCPSRERGGWLHDSYWTAQAVYTLFGDTSVNRRMSRQVAQSQDDPHHIGPAGLVSALYPSNMAAFNCVLPGHDLFWILQVGLDSSWTGDLAYTRSLLPAVRRLLTAFDQSCNADGMLEIPFPWPAPQPRCWNFLDWADIKDTGVSLGLNALYVVALERAAALERLAGEPPLADDDQRRATRVRQAIERLCPGDGYYPDTLIRSAEGQLTPSAEMSESTQYFVLWAGLASPERTAKLWARLRDAFQPTPTRRVQPIDGLTRAGFYSFPERLELAVRQGDSAAFLRDMKLMFQPMVESPPGTLWETPWADASLCHGLGSMAAAMLTEKTLGLSLSLPLTIAPRALADLTWCQGYRTLSQGRVSVAWTRTADQFVIKVNLPEAVDGQVVLPNEAKTIWQAKPAPASWPEHIPVRGSSTIRVSAGSIQIE